MRVQGITDACSDLWARGATALIGISPFNSYFDEARIRRILAACRSGGREALVFIPDAVTTHTLEARGYPPAKAAKKTRRQVQYLRNKIRRASDGDPPKIIGCAELNAEPAYGEHRASLARLFDSNPRFRDGCLGTTRWVLASEPGDEVSESAAMHGVQYLLAELPLFLSATEVLARREVVFVYHQCPAFIRALYAGDYGDMRVSGQGFVTLGDESAEGGPEEIETDA